MCFTLTDMELAANPDGWVGRFFPKKQRGVAVQKTFLVPRNVGQGALDVFSVVNPYNSHRGTSRRPQRGIPSFLVYQHRWGPFRVEEDGL